MIYYKSAREIALMKTGGHILAEVLERLRTAVKPGMSTLEIDEDVEAFITTRGAKPAFKGYRGFPATVCISINDEVVHGIPSARRRLREGDVVGFDLGCIVEGYYADCAATLPIGAVAPAAQKLLDVTRESLELAIEECRPDRRLSDVSHAVQRHVEAHGFGVVRAFVGHGIGRALHEEPQIPNFGEPGRGPRLRPGMVLAVEPMVTMGNWEVRVLDDGWTAVTQDGSLAAHFEHTIAVTEEGPVVLTTLNGHGGGRRRASHGQGRRDRGRGHSGRAAAERDVPGGTGERPPGARSRQRQDAHELHPYSAGDRVKVELSPYDLTRGRITYRFK